MLIQRTNLHKLSPGQSCPWSGGICCLYLPWGVLSTWVSIPDLLVYCGVWALQTRRLHKGIWRWAPVILWWITGMTLTGTNNSFESGGNSWPFFFFSWCYGNPIYIHIVIQPRGLTWRDCCLSSYDLIMSVGVNWTVSSQVSRTEGPPDSKVELCIQMYEKTCQQMWLAPSSVDHLIWKWLQCITSFYLDYRF